MKQIYEILIICIWTEGMRLFMENTVRDYVLSREEEANRIEVKDIFEMLRVSMQCKVCIVFTHYLYQLGDIA